MCVYKCVFITTVEDKNVMNLTENEVESIRGCWKEGRKGGNDVNIL